MNPRMVAILGILTWWLAVVMVGHVALLLTPGVAHSAPPPCDPTQPLSADKPYMHFVPKDYFQRVEAGWIVFVACKDPTTKLWSMHGGACRHGVCNQADWTRAIVNFGTAFGYEAKKQSFIDSWNKIIVEDCTAPADPLNVPVCDVYRQVRDMVGTELNKVPLPPAPRFVVRSNGAYTTRPSYSWDGTTRGTDATAERAAVGAECRPVAGSYGTFGPEFRADRVALCSLVSP